jgi:hypothetical protein
MKHVLLSISALLFSAVMFAQTGKKIEEIAKFKEETIDLGKIIQDNPQTAVFEVTNISDEAILIEQANPTCGCTIGDYTKTPIAPGATGTIKATYNAKNLGGFEKNLMVKFAGVAEMKAIKIKGEVIANTTATPAPAANPAVDAAPAVEKSVAAPVVDEKKQEVPTKSDENKRKTNKKLKTSDQ